MTWYSTSGADPKKQVGEQRGAGYTACMPCPSTAKMALFVMGDPGPVPIKYSSFSDAGCTKEGPKSVSMGQVDVSKNHYFKVTKLD